VIKLKLLLLSCTLGAAGSTWSQQPDTAASATKASDNCADVAMLEKRVADMNGRLMDWPQLG